MTHRRLFGPLSLPGMLFLAGLALPAPGQQAPADPVAPADRADPSPAAEAEARPPRHPDHHNLGKGRLALEGYDPVAYFAEGGSKARKGDKRYTLRHGEVVYVFVSAEHRKLFLADPARYEPAFGGWCAWAMAQDDGEKVEVDPKSFLVQDGRLLVFYKGFFADTRKQWIRAKDTEALADRADENWKRLSGESPRKPKQETEVPGAETEPPADG